MNKSYNIDNNDVNLLKPIINTNINTINVKTIKSYEGIIEITNVSDGNLEGNIFCNDSFITLSTNIINSNKIIVNYVINVTKYYINETLTSEIKIMTNGGDIIIPIKVKIIESALKTRSNVNINTIHDFTKFYYTNQLECISLFYTKKFITWLKTVNSTYPYIYDIAVQDSNTNRALETFLYMVEAKEPPKIICSGDEICIYVLDNKDEIITGNIPIFISGSGYTSVKIYDSNLKEFNTNWIKINKKIIESTDFDINKQLSLTYEINTKKINKRVVNEKIIIGENEIKITVKKIPIFICSINKEVYKNQEQGFITITNNTQKKIELDIKTNSNFISLNDCVIMLNEKESYNVLFNIDFKTIHKAQNIISKKPYYKVEIIVEHKEKIHYSKKLELIIVGNKLENNLSTLS